MKISQKNQRCLIEIDHYLDFVPFGSIINNLPILVTKIALDIFVKYTKIPKEESLKNRLFLRHIDCKGYFETVVLLFPFINIGMAYILLLDRREAVPKEETSRQAALQLLTSIHKFKTQWEQLRQKEIEQWSADELDLLQTNVKKVKQTIFSLDDINTICPLELMTARHAAKKIPIGDPMCSTLAISTIVRDNIFKVKSVNDKLKNELVFNCDSLVIVLKTNFEDLLPENFEASLNVK